MTRFIEEIHLVDALDEVGKGLRACGGGVAKRRVHEIDIIEHISEVAARVCIQLGILLEVIEDVAEIFRSYLLILNLAHECRPCVVRVNRVAQFLGERLVPLVNTFLLHIACEGIVDGFTIIDNQQPGVFQEAFLFCREVTVEDETEDIITELAGIHLATQRVRHSPQLGCELSCSAFVCRYRSRISHCYLFRVCHDVLSDVGLLVSKLISVLTVISNHEPSGRRIPAAPR